jgi:hypothetical protein
MTDDKKKRTLRQTVFGDYVDTETEETVTHKSDDDAVVSVFD